jgi:hypothetical protein
MVRPKEVVALEKYAHGDVRCLREQDAPLAYGICGIHFRRLAKAPYSILVATGKLHGNA